MHDEHGPRRLRQGNDTPEALLRAIDALRKGADDSARLSRVGQKLDAVLNAPPTAAASSAAQQSGLFGQKLSSLKLILGGLALLVALTPLLFRQHSDDGAVPGADRDGSSAAPTSATPVAPSEEARTEEHAVETPVTEAASPELSPAPAPTPARRASKHAARPRERTSAREAREVVTARVEAPEAAASVNAELPQAAAEPVDVPREPQRPAAKPEPPKTAPPVPAEADLLLQARKALKVDPSLALRLATDHQTYYPKGRLVPEREVLAIEALRSLGRKQEAEERLKKFEARYPKSIHLQRLHEGL